jgi:hypothetical protein
VVFSDREKIAHTRSFWQHYNENGNIYARGIKIDNRWVGR